jgi:pilus assembly protein CpaF
MIPKSVYENSIRSFFTPILPFLDDPTVTEVMINGPKEIFVERKGQLTRVDAQFSGVEELMSALRNVAQFIGRPFDEYHPILEGRLPDGSRLEAVLPPISPDGPSVAIRRFSKDKLTIAKLLEFGALHADAAQLLEGLIASKQNVIVAGGTGSGKTSMLNCLSSFIPRGDRIVIIEDARELQLQQDHVVQMEARPADARGKGQITIRDLFKATLRMRPDRIVVGEIRGGEALELVQAMTSGHGGCLSTVHATYPKDTLSRLETMALMSNVELPLVALRAQIASAVNAIVQTARLSDGSRGITHITEVIGCDANNNYILNDLFVRTYAGRGGTSIKESQFLPTGNIPECLDAIIASGFNIPQAMYAAHAARRA